MKLERKELCDWERFYREVFNNLRLDFSGIKIPEPVQGFDRLLVIAHLLDAETLGTFNSGMQIERHYHNEDDYRLISSARRNNGDCHAVWVKDSEKPDGLSIGEVKFGVKPAHPEITFEEEMILRLKHFWENNEHLYSRDWTRCAGSHLPNRNSPIVGWHTESHALMISLDRLPCVCRGHSVSRYVICGE